MAHKQRGGVVTLAQPDRNLEWPVPGLVMVGSDAQRRILFVTGDGEWLRRAQSAGLTAGRTCPDELPGWVCRRQPVPPPDPPATGQGGAGHGYADVWWAMQATAPDGPLLSLALRATSVQVQLAAAVARVQCAEALLEATNVEWNGAGLALVTGAGTVLLATAAARRFLGLEAAGSEVDLSVAIPFLWQKVSQVCAQRQQQAEVRLVPPAVPIFCRVTVRPLPRLVAPPRGEWNLAAAVGREAVPGEPVAAAALVIRPELSSLAGKGSSKRDFAQATARFTFDHLLTASPLMTAAINVARSAARTDVPVLLTGETGTGKELVAQAIHNGSARARGPFVALNCGAIPEQLVASELFGYEAGAFTGARPEGRIGKFQQADGGTLFLDEVGEMPLELQVSLLRVLEQREVTRLGGRQVTPVDVRIVAATNRNLWSAVQSGGFRADLYYRLNVVEVHLPSLRERREDIPILATVFAEREAAGAGRPACPISDPVLMALAAYDWPGNVRELYNLIKRAAMLATGDRITLQELPPQLLPPSPPSAANQAPVAAPVAAMAPAGTITLAEVQRTAIQEAIQKAGGNLTRAARSLGIARATLYRRLQSDARRDDN